MSSSTESSRSSTVTVTGGTVAEEKQGKGTQRDAGQSPLRRHLLEDIGNSRTNDIFELRKKISDLELKHAEQSHMNNEELVKAQSEVARLRALCEKDQVTIQKLQYDLTVVNKKMHEERKVGKEQEQHWRDETEELRELSAKLQAQVASLQEQLNAEASSRTHEVDGLKELLQKKDVELRQKDENLRNCSKELSKLDKHAQDLMRSNDELQERCATLESQRTSQNDTLRKVMNDLDKVTNREEKLRQEFEECQEKLRSAKESLDEEKTCNIQAKRSSDVLQIRIRELETSLNAERMAVEELQLQCKDLVREKGESDAAAEKLKEAAEDMKSLMISKDDQHCTELNNLLRELQDSQQATSKLSKQLEMHQNNFNDLKNELAETKKKQVSLESTYGSSMRELELLMDKFWPSSFQDGNSKEGPDRMKAVAPAIVLSNLRRMLSDYQNRIDHYSKETENFKESLYKLSTESDNYKELLWNKDQRLEEKKRQLKEAEEQLGRFRSQCAHLERRAAVDKNQILELQSFLRDEKQRLQSSEMDIQIYEREVGHLKENLQRTEEAYLTFLQSCHHHLTDSFDPIPAKARESYEAKKIPELGHCILEGIQRRMSDLRKAREQAAELQTAASTFERDLEMVKEKLQNVLSQSSRTIQDREEMWKKQESKMKHCYDHVVESSQRDLKDLRAKLSTAKEDVNQLRCSNLALEAQNQKLKNAVFQLQHEKSCLLTSCTLISGTLWPAYVSLHMASQCIRHLSRCYMSLEYIRTELARLVHIMNAEMNEGSGNLRPGHQQGNGDAVPPILRFRVSVIAVLAMNRFSKLGKTSRTFFISTKCPGMKKRYIPVILGNYDRTEVSLNENKERKPARKTPNACHAVAWLSCPRLVPIASKAVGHLVEELQKFTIGEDKLNSRFSDEGKRGALRSLEGVRSLASAAHAKLIDCLEPEFTTIPPRHSDRPQPQLGSESRLCFKLAEALHSLLNKNASVWGWYKYSSSRTLISQLQRHIVLFTQRLQSAETDRRSMRRELLLLKKDKESLSEVVKREKAELAKVREDDVNLHDHVNELREEMANMVPVYKFQSVCAELSAALRREEETSELLKEQTDQLKELEKRIEEFNQRLNDKGADLSEAWKALTEAKGELIKRDQKAKRLTQSVTDFETERARLLANLAESELNLKTLSRERTVFVNYLRAAEIALAQTKQQMTCVSNEVCEFDYAMPELILPEDQLGLEGLFISKDMKLCQKTVETFLRVHQQSLREIGKLKTAKNILEHKITSLGTEVEAHQNHAASLKDELKAVCRRRHVEDQLANLRTSQHSEGRLKDAGAVSIHDLPSKDRSSRAFSN